MRTELAFEPDDELVAEPEPIVIPVGGQRLDAAGEWQLEVHDVEFRGRSPIGPVLDTITMPGGEAVIRYLAANLTETGKVAWKTVTDDPDLVVTPKTVGAVYRSLIGAQSGRPTSGSPASRPGRPSTKRTSRVVSHVEQVSLSDVSSSQ